MVDIRQEYWEILYRRLEEAEGEAKANFQAARGDCDTTYDNDLESQSNKQLFKSCYMEALKKIFTNFEGLIDENAISDIANLSTESAFLLEEMNTRHQNKNPLMNEINIQLLVAKERLGTNMHTAMSARINPFIDENLFKILRSNNFGGNFGDATLNYAYSSYCKILELQQKMSSNQQVLEQGINDIKSLIGIVEDLKSKYYHQNSNLTHAANSLQKVSQQITKLSEELQPEDAKGLLSRFFERFRKSKRLPVENTDTIDFAELVSSVKCIGINNNTDEYAERIEQYEQVLQERKQDKENEQGSDITPYNEDNFLQGEDDLEAENTDLKAAYAQQNYLKLQGLQKLNKSQQLTIAQDTQDMESLLTLINQLREEYEKPKEEITTLISRLDTVIDEINKLYPTLATAKTKKLATRLVESITKRKTQNFDAGDQLLKSVSEIIDTLITVAASYPVTLDNEQFNQIISRAKEREKDKDTINRELTYADDD